MERFGASKTSHQALLSGCDPAAGSAEPIAPARGIAVALALGSLGWAALAGLVLAVRALLGG